jgi:AdoMet-dependent rRNA methyltransferase SPB1
VGKNGIVTKVSNDAGFEIVPAETEMSALAQELMPGRVDPRSYDSDSEDYDTHDRTRTLALGTMMLRHSKKKALVDASYNRFAWNDPKNLPSWFMDDEMRHNKPQLPIPNALLEQVRLGCKNMFFSRSARTMTDDVRVFLKACA